MKEKGTEDDAEMSYHASGLPLSDTVKYILVLFISLFCPTLSDPMDCSPPGSSVHGIFQATILEWIAIAFSSLKAVKHYSQHRSFFVQMSMERWADELDCRARAGLQELVVSFGGIL